MSTTLTIQLPTQLAAHLENRVQAGSCDDPSDYIRDLIERDRQMSRSEAVRWIESQVLPALDSLDRGEGHDSSPEFWSRSSKGCRSSARDFGIDVPTLRIRYSLIARDDLINHWEYLGGNSRSIADRYFDAVSNAVDSLAEFPFKGAALPLESPKAQGLRR
jgi:Arc/MetJ-type ribon-helix-helix transcriptional regulator